MDFKSIHLRRKQVKEALDHLPSGICYFNKKGILMLCNHRMDTLFHEMTHHDVQHASELLNEIDNLAESMFFSSNGTIWKFHYEEIDGLGTECIAVDVTELYRKNQLLQERHAQLEEVVATMQEINRNVVEIAREEEILSMKMRVHSQVGKSLISLQRYVSANASPKEKEALIQQMESTLRMLKGEVGQTDDIDIVQELQESAAAIGVSLQFDGALPDNQQAIRLIVAAAQECITNLVKHAEGDTLFISTAQHEEHCVAELTNNGVPPKEEIVESGGLGSLRQRVEKTGAEMVLSSFPSFKLTIRIPNKGEMLL